VGFCTWWAIPNINRPKFIAIDSNFSDKPYAFEASVKSYRHQDAWYKRRKSKLRRPKIFMITRKVAMVMLRGNFFDSNSVQRATFSTFFVSNTLRCVPGYTNTCPGPGDLVIKREIWLFVTKMMTLFYFQNIDTQLWFYMGNWTRARYLLTFGWPTAAGIGRENFDTDSTYRPRWEALPEGKGQRDGYFLLGNPKT